MHPWQKQYKPDLQNLWLKKYSDLTAGCLFFSPWWRNWECLVIASSDSLFPSSHREVYSPSQDGIIFLSTCYSSLLNPMEELCSPRRWKVFWPSLTTHTQLCSCDCALCAWSRRCGHSVFRVFAQTVRSTRIFALQFIVVILHVLYRSCVYLILSNTLDIFLTS